MAALAPPMYRYGVTAGVSLRDRFGHFASSSLKRTCVPILYQGYRLATSLSVGAPASEDCGADNSASSPARTVK